jgi:hypothetical protein
MMGNLLTMPRFVPQLDIHGIRDEFWFHQDGNLLIMLWFAQNLDIFSIRDKFWFHQDGASPH